MYGSTTGSLLREQKNVNPNGEYNSIHNCINFNDPVPKVAPIGMNFVRYGVDHVFNDNDVKTNVSNVKKQLAMISPETTFDDYYHLATLLLVAPKLNWLFCTDSDMLKAVTDDNIKDAAPANAGKYTDELLDKLQTWAINSRENFVEVPDEDLRTDKSLDKVSFEKSLQLVMPIMFAKSSEELDKLTEIASQRVNDLDMTGIYSNILRGNWTNQSVATKKKWIWEKLWNVLVEPSDGEGVASALTKQELIDLKTAWPTLIDTLLKFANKDYNFGDWVGGVPKAEKGLNVIATLMYNSTTLLQTHYPEVNYAWLRTEDSNYNNESSIINVTSNVTPSVNYSLTEGSYNGMQVLKLDTKVDGKDNGAAIFYQLTTEVNGKTTTSSWMPYNKQIILPTGVDSNGDQTTAKYTVKTRAALANKESQVTSKTYTINKEKPIQIEVVDQNGDKIASYECDKGKNITIPATNVDGKFFVEWTSVDNDKITIADTDKTKQSLTMKMPEDMTAGKTVTVKAKYQDKINQVEITDLKEPTPNEKFAASANVALKGQVKDGSETATIIDAKNYDVQWVKVSGDDEAIVKTEKPEYNTTYRAVIVLKPETGKCEFVDKDKFKSVTVNGKKIDKPRIEKKNDGSYWIFTDEMKTEESEFKSAQAISIKGQTGTELNDLTLPDSVLIQATDGYKIASIKSGTLKSENYNKNNAGTYDATAEINLSGTGVKAKDDLTPTVDVTITLEGKSIAEAPILDADSQQNAYKGTKTIKFNDVETAGTIYYKVEKVDKIDSEQADDQTDATGFKKYNKETGIQLEQPEAKGKSTNYKVTAYTKVDGKADSAQVTFHYSICNPYKVTVNYVDTGLGDTERKPDTYTYFPDEMATIIAPEISSESFSNWKDAEGIELTDANKTNKSIQVEKLTSDITITAVYNPVVKQVNLKIKKPSTGENLATHVESCEYTVDHTYDLEKSLGELLSIESWNPEESSGVAAADKAYTAKLSMQFNATVGDNKDIVFKVSPDLKVTATDEDGKDVPVEVQQTSSTLIVFCNFAKTEKAKAVSMTQPKDITVPNGTSEKDILNALDQTAAVKLSTGAIENADITWNLKDYNKDSKSVQAVTATGTLTIPDYIDAADIADKDNKVTVTAKVYVEGAERVQTPQASMQSGTYIGAQKVTLSCATEGAKIYYTTDGETPTTSSTLYKEGTEIELKQNTVLTVMAVKDGMQDSASESYDYTIHNHVDSNHDGKCDGITITGKEETQSCDTVFLGRSGDSTDTVYGSVKQEDGKGTIYVQVNASDIFEKTDANSSDTSTQAEETSGEDRKNDTNIQWKYSNSVYPTTNLKYEYKVKDADGKDTSTTEQHNYIFAGWYKAETTTTKADDDGDVQTTTKMTPYDKMPEETAYAKFVDASVLGVKAQVTSGTTSESEKTDMRFLTTVDGLNYKKVGFVITCNGKTIDASSTIVYEKVLASVNGEVITKEPTAEMGNDISKYFMPYKITEIPKEVFTTEFSITPYWITMDGTTVSGKQTQKKISDSPDYK